MKVSLQYVNDFGDDGDDDCDGDGNDDDLSLIFLRNYNNNKSSNIFEPNYSFKYFLI